MHNFIKLVTTNKINSIQNINFLINTVSNISQRINNPSIHSSNLNILLNKISNPITEFVTHKDLEVIDILAGEFFTKDFSNKAFLKRDLSNKLHQLWNILNEIYDYNPEMVVDCIYRIIGKKIPKEIDETEKTKISNDLLSKFSGTSKRVNSVTDLIFNQVKYDHAKNTFDVLSICGMLLSFVLNSQSHLYFVMENIKEAISILKKSYDIEEIFSIESKVIQNTNFVTDIQAIRNAVSHGSFSLKLDSKVNEHIIDFQSVLTGYSFNKRYTGSEMLTLYGIYDNLRNFQELLIRMIFLKATLKLYFFK